MNFLKCLLKIHYYGVWFPDWFLDEIIKLTSWGEKFCTSYALLHFLEGEKSFYAESFLKKWNPNISDSSSYLSTLPAVADHLAACTEGRPGKIAKMSYGEQVQKW